MFWLVRAYIKKWKRTILLYFGLGLAGFFILYFFIRLFQPSLPFRHKEVVGLIGSYTVNNLPAPILDKLSYGLTEVSPDGMPIPKAASSWSIQDNGKTYVFRLKDNLYFNDHKKLNSDLINYNFEDVNLVRPSKNTIVFKLKDSYSPFLITVSRPILKKGFVGLKDFSVRSVDLNGEFVNSVEIYSKTSGEDIVYQFYPTEEALKNALVLNEITQTDEVSYPNFQNSSLTKFKNYKIQKSINYNKLVTLFYNTQDKVVSEKRFREALAYSLPNNFDDGKRTRTPYPPTLWASQERTYSYEQDVNHAKSLLSQSQASSSANLKLTITTMPKYQKVAQSIKDSWALIGLKTNIEVVNSIPTSFQIFLGEFNVSKDPDQYVLWHSGSSSNITGYKNLRIDKLLEDGRRITDYSERQKIYSDFQKYLLDDPPASFLFFPYKYSFSK